MLKEVYFESVRLGHPDKMCDFIADSILDEYYKQDKEARVACECFFTGHKLVIGGEITSTATVDIVKVAKDCIEKIGYNDNDFEVENLVSKQSPEIANLVDSWENLGAGDQGVVVGYACKSYNSLPVEFTYIQRLMMMIDHYFQQEPELSGMMPDGKGFIAISTGNVRVHVSYEAKDDGKTAVRQAYLTKMAKELYKTINLDKKYGEDIEVTFVEYYLGGPLADTGLTGRKIIVDTYGGAAPHGGGSFSGKDGTKVDRTGAYLAHQIAVSLVDSNICEEATVWLGYAIGEGHPVSLKLELKGYSGGKEGLQNIEEDIFSLLQTSEFSLQKVIRRFYEQDLFNNFASLSAYGHFGRVYEWDMSIPSILGVLC